MPQQYPLRPISGPFKDFYDISNPNMIAKSKGDADLSSRNRNCSISSSGVGVANSLTQGQVINLIMNSDLLKLSSSFLARRTKTTIGLQSFLSFSCGHSIGVVPFE